MADGIYVVNQNKASSNGTNTCTLTMDGCTVGNTLILAYAVRGDGNDPTLSNGWVKLGGGNNIDTSAGINQRLFFAHKKVESEIESITLTQTTTSRIYLVCSEYAGVSDIRMRDDLSAIGTTGYTVRGAKTNSDDVMLYGVTSIYYVSSGQQQSVTPADLTKIYGDTSEERLACWFDDGTGALEHAFRSCDSPGAYSAILECVQLIAKGQVYKPFGQAEYLIDTSYVGCAAGSAITWSADSPNGTTLKVSARLSGGDYTECQNGGSIPVISDGDDLTGSALEVKVEMSTEDTSVTPSLSDLEIVIRDAGDDCVIVLSLTPGNITSIQNAIGEVSVSYGGGSLLGQGGPVQDFSLSFTPEGLEPKHHPHDTEHIAVDVKVNATLTRIYYTDASETEHIEVAVDPIATLILVDDI